MRIIIASLAVMLTLSATVGTASAKVPGEEWKVCAFRGN